MKFIKKIFFFLFIAILFTTNVKANNKVNVYLFHSETCLHCQAEIEWLNSIKDEYNIEIHLYEVDSNKENMNFMISVANKLNINSPLTPFTIIGDTYYTGFEDSTKESINELIIKEKENPSVDVMDKILNEKDVSDITIKKGVIDNIHTIFGTFNPKTISLPILTIIMGFIDGFNPCAMWVLLFLISMIIGMKNRKKMWILGLTFLTTSALVYMVFMLAWLNVSKFLNSISWLRLLIALIAIIGGIFNLYNYYKLRKQENGCHVVDTKKRKNIFKKIKNIIANAEAEGNFWQKNKSFILALIGIIGLAISVNIIELACSSGFPAIYTQVLVLNELNSLQYFLYILLYIIFFLFDDILVFAIAMKTLQVTGISTKYNKLSHLIGGILMLIIGLLMAFKPEILMFNF